jgi:putative ABC transport system permease protein
MTRPWLWRIVEWRLGRRLPHGQATAVLGDLLEDYRRDHASRGAWRANLRVLAEARSIARAYRRPAPASRIANSGAVRQDLRYAVRMFVRQPRFTIVALATLALGIGGNVAVSSIARAILAPSLPIPDADRVVRVYQSRADRTSGSGGTTSAGLFRRWQDGTRDLFAAMTAYRTSRVTLSGDGPAARLDAVEATPDIFVVMAAPLVIGRPFTAADVAAESPVVVISEDLWQQRFNGDRGIVGRTIRLDGTPWTILGVAAAGLGFPFSGGPDLWRPLVLPESLWSNSTATFLDVVGRLHPAVPPADANARLASITASAFADSKARWTAFAEDFLESESGRYRDRLRLLQGITGVILLIAGVNLANLLLASATTRRRELALRASLGADRWRLVRQLLTEGLVLSGAGAVAGLAIAAWAAPAIVAAYPDPLPSYQSASIGWREISVAAALAVATTCLFSLAPVLAVTRPGIVDGLKDGAGAGSSRAVRILRAGLVAAEVALALALVVGGGLLVRSYWRLTSQPLHFDPENVMAIRVAAAEARYPTEEARRRFFADTIAAIADLPGIGAAGAATRLPFDGSGAGGSVELDAGDGKTRRLPVSTRTVAGDYFLALGIAIVQGRALGAADDERSPPTVVVSESLALRIDPSAPVVGRRLRRSAKSPWMTIVGVAAEARSHFRWRAQPEVYFPLGHADASEMQLVVRAEDGAPPAAARIAETIRGRDPEIPLGTFETAAHMIGASVGRDRFHLALLTILACLATLLAVVGIAGVMTYVVGQRTREIGIRMALGAPARRVQRLLVKQGLVPVVVGLAGGLIASWWLTSLIESALFEVSPRDPSTLTIAALLFLIVGVLSCWWPTRGASRIDPVVTLRSE